MATISITFLGAAVSFIATLVMSKWSLGYLDCRIPFDISILSEHNVPGYFTITDINDIPSMDYKGIIDYLDGSDNNIEEYYTIEKYFINKDDFYIKEKYQMPFLAIKLSDFNNLRSMLGYDGAKIFENQYVESWSKNNYSELMSLES